MRSIFISISNFFVGLAGREMNSLSTELETSINEERNNTRKVTKHIILENLSIS